MTLLLIIGILVGVKNVSAVDTSYIHMEFRWNDAYDRSYNQTKYTTSSYVLNSTKVTRPWYSAKAMGTSRQHPNQDVSNGNTYSIKEYHTYYLTNYLVEWQGKGQSAYILTWSYGNGAAYGSWRADR